MVHGVIHLMVLSLDTETTVFPSRLKARLFTPPVCPSIFIFSDPVFVSHILNHHNNGVEDDHIPTRVSQVR